MFCLPCILRDVSTQKWLDPSKAPILQFTHIIRSGIHPLFVLEKSSKDDKHDHPLPWNVEGNLPDPVSPCPWGGHRWTPSWHDAAAAWQVAHQLRSSVCCFLQMLYVALGSRSRVVDCHCQSPLQLALFPPPWRSLRTGRLPHQKHMPLIVDHWI